MKEVKHSVTNSVRPHFAIKKSKTVIKLHSDQKSPSCLHLFAPHCVLQLLLLVHLSLIFVFFTSSFGTHGISISDARQEKSVLPPLSGLKKQLPCQLPVLVHSPSVDEVSMACSSTSVFQQHRRLFKMMRSCIVSLNVAEIGSTVELSNTGNTVAKPSVFVTAPSWCLVLEVSPLGVPSKGFSYFFMDKKVKEKMSFALLHQTLKSVGWQGLPSG